MTRSTSTFLCRRPIAALGALACVACCALPLAAGAVGIGTLSVLGSALGWLGGLLLVVAALAWALAHRRTSTTPEPAICASDGGCGCKPCLARRPEALGCALSDAELPKREAAFRAMFGRGLRQREAGGEAVVWTFVWSEELERDVLSLAASEQACCSFWRFRIERVGDELRWEARVPPDKRDAIAWLDGLVQGTRGEAGNPVPTATSPELS
jgi:hypothetical protein